MKKIGHLEKLQLWSPLRFKKEIFMPCPYQGKMVRGKGPFRVTDP